MPTRAERKATTRARLLDAAALLVAAKGVEGATVDAIATCAGVTTGALYASFPSKVELLAGVALQCEERLTAGLAATPSPSRLPDTVAALWSQVEEPAFQALVELVRAGRSDLELRTALQASDARAAQLFQDALARALGPELAARPEFRRNAKVLGLALYGTALTAPLRTQVARRRLLQDVQELACELFPAAQEASACG